MNVSTARTAAIVGLVVLALALQACVPKQQVSRTVERGYQAQGDDVMFLYREDPGNDRGLLRCSVDDEGNLQDCRDISIVFNDEDLGNEQE